MIWPQEVTLVRWTQPSGPLCLWQCSFYTWPLHNIKDVGKARCNWCNIKTGCRALPARCVGGWTHWVSQVGTSSSAAPVVERSKLCSCWLGLRRSVDIWRFSWRTGVSWAEDSSRIVSNCEKGTNNSQLIQHQVLQFWQTHLVLSKRKTETNWIWKTLEDLRSVFTQQRWELLLTL